MALDLVACPDCGGVGYVTPYHLHIECEGCLGEGCVPVDLDSEPRVPDETTRRVLAAGFSGVCDCGSDMVACDKCGRCISHCHCSVDDDYMPPSKSKLDRLCNICGVLKQDPNCTCCDDCMFLF